MRIILLVLLLAGSVVIEFDQTELTACLAPPPVVTRNADGTYSRLENLYRSWALACMVRSQWREEWTDYPERGGTFMRRLPQESQ